MAIRLVRAVLDDTGHVDLDLWAAQVGIGLPVGLCDCGGSADGEPIVGGRRLVFASARCRGCGVEASRPVPATPIAA